MTQANKIKLKMKSTTPASQKILAIIKIQQYYQVGNQCQKHLLPLRYQNQYLTQRAARKILRTKNQNNCTGKQNGVS